MITTIKKYRTADGKEFDTWNDAWRHEAILNRISKIEALLLKQTSGGETITVSELAELLGCDKSTLLASLNQIVATSEASDVVANAVK